MNPVRRIAIWVLKHRQLNAITDQEIFELIDFGIAELNKVPTLIEVPTPTQVYGDLHGQLTEIIELIERTAPALLNLEEPEMNMLFLGDYVDRGEFSLELITLLICLKLLFPTRVHLLRGNHECSDVNKRFGFYRDVMAKRNGNIKIWMRFNALFKELPLCALVSGHILCMHGGLPRLKNWQWSELTETKKPRIPSECYEGIANDLLWADPSNDNKELKDARGKKQNYVYNHDRHTSILFNDSYIREFMEHFPHIKGIVRAHECMSDGYKLNGAKNLYTIFSAARYCNENNKAAMLTIEKITSDSKLTGQLTILEARSNRAEGEQEQQQEEDPRTPRP